MTLSPSLVTNPLISTWLTFDDAGGVILRVGKVELGQGIHTALKQIAARELGLPDEVLVMAQPSTATSPDEGWTVGSMSTEVSGGAVRTVCAAARRLFIEAAARRADCPPGSLTVVDGNICSQEGEVVSSYALLAREVDLEVEATDEIPAAMDPAKRDLQRIDLPDKVFGRRRFIHDMELPGMLHARVIRPPLLRASLQEVPADVLSSLPASVAVVKDGNFLAVFAEREEAVMEAAARLMRAVSWDALDELPDESKLPDWLRNQESETAILFRQEGDGEARSGRVMRARYSRGLIAHASIATSCALARFDGRLEVWSHTQGIFPLRGAIADALDVPLSDVVVHHVEGAGCYGHNPADDVAFDAALLSRHTDGRPVRVLWDRAAELGSAPLGSAMTADVSAQLSAAGSISNWSYEVWSNGFLGRPGFTGPALLANGFREGGTPMPPATDPGPEMGLGSGRNAIHPYSFNGACVARHLVRSMPIRTSSIRSLGAHFNVFAIESFMDELAAEAGEDPLGFRLARLADDRGRAVITAAAAKAGWGGPLEGGGGADVGRGLGYAQYKNKGMYCAVVAEVEAAETVTVRRLVVAVDVGRVVNLDGVRNQVEGGAVQAASWTLREQIRFDSTGVTSLGWDTYPILRFSEVPRVDVVVIDQPDYPSVGAGEGAAGPVAGAIANGLFAAIGVRVRSLPLTSENVVKAIDEAEPSS
ncbi:MAG: xanthine dehydrogenase family protein molybdopterin-binding subunit [Modestobacter sp.]|jgi:CO/xanthine dehydrogenase Mo-binding subunit|nr:xanthine dehydrogenase family protein molybdopterin-binding subunit [Modestobacter sp.]